MTMNSKIAQWVAFHLPPTVLLWAVVRGFAAASTYGKNAKRTVDALKYQDVYKALVAKYKIREA